MQLAGLAYRAGVVSGSVSFRGAHEAFRVDRS